MILFVITTALVINEMFEIDSLPSSFFLLLIDKLLMKLLNQGNARLKYFFSFRMHAYGTYVFAFNLRQYIDMCQKNLFFYKLYRKLTQSKLSIFI